jgi:hypothetical protein
MDSSLHNFHIPVMGTGHSVDSPVRVAPFGIASVISLVDDLLVEKIRSYYCKTYDLPYEKIPRKAEDGRAKRITAYLDTVDDVINLRFEKIKSQGFYGDTDKDRYFRMLPDDSPMKKAYLALESLEGKERLEEELRLTNLMEKGSIDVNIMVKLDRVNYQGDEPMSDEYSDAKAALRGYAQSKISSGIVFSAGINQSLFGYMATFDDFFRDAQGKIKKKIILKVSDFRSAMIQGKFLARKGLEVCEFRVESGLNCGGHAFPSEGELLPSLLKEFSEKRHQLKEQFLPSILKVYEASGRVYPSEAESDQPLLTVQGGIGTWGEDQRLRRDYGVDRTGWASPFLLVPEATCIDKPTLELVRRAKEEDLYLSGASPLGIPFNNVRNSGSDLWTRGQAEKGNPGSACPKGFLISNTEFSDRPICTASKEYQKQKLEELELASMSDAERERVREVVLEKACICDHLGNGALIALGMARETLAPQSICPGPNVAWFDKIYSLEQMIDHIYGRGDSLVPTERPHMYAKEVAMYLEWVGKLASQVDGDQKLAKRLMKILESLTQGVEYCESVCSTEVVGDENLASLSGAVVEAKSKIEALKSRVQAVLS